ncbi:MAG: SGNH/GDSL hydrolase family protein [Erysipelotrichaceae bacterium]|nr:SGNH/GDSL hydrolase family protein [Erysipelotrichaceae bacterium]
MTGFLIIIFVSVVWIACCGYFWGWGPFCKLHEKKSAGLKGNSAQYDLKNAGFCENSALKGKNIIFLGSSVTYGAASQGISFADYICQRNGCHMIKEAVSGTTLVDDRDDSYISRLRTIREECADLFVCQLSTNDATQKKPLGSVGDAEEISGFDTNTVAGAIGYIIQYVTDKWHCPVVFYTNPKYESEAYGQMVAMLCRLSEKYGFPIINLWDDDDFNNITEEERKLYMADPIHPTKAGYLTWWVPYFEKELVKQTVLLKETEE